MISIGDSTHTYVDDNIIILPVTIFTEYGYNRANKVYRVSYIGSSSTDKSTWIMKMETLKQLTTCVNLKHTYYKLL